MTKNEIMVIVGLASAAAAAIGYAVGQRKKLQDISKKIDKSIEEMSTSIDIDVDKALVKKAVAKAVDQTVDAVVHDEVRTQANKVINGYRVKMEEELTSRVNKAIDEVDISKVKQVAVERASDKAARKVTEGLEYIFNDFRSNLRRMTEKAVNTAASTNTITLRL